MKENSIEEDITRIKQRIEDVKEYIEYGLPYSEYLDLENSFDNILSDYKRVLKENEELKQDRNNNYQMIALAQNEMLGYMQGYEDGKKLNRSAVACVVENQQYYIINKEIEHYKEYIQKLQKENKELRKKLDEENKRCMMLAIEKQDCFEKYRYHLQQNESLTKEFSNVIPVQKIKDKIEELNKAYEDSKDENGESEYYYPDYTIRVLEELLESE